MASWCRIDDLQLVIEVIDFDPAGKFDASLIWYSCPDGTEQGYIKDGVTFRPVTAEETYPTVGFENDYIYDVEKAKRQKQGNIDSGYTAAEDVPVTMGGFDFDASNNALAEINSISVAVLNGEALPAGFTWIDTSGVEVPADAAMMAALQKSVAIKHYNDSHKYARRTKEIEAATTIAEVAIVEDW
jgi:hypothetical protein